LLSLLRRWWLFLLGGAILGGLVGNLVASNSAPTYRADVKLLVGPINAESLQLEASGALSRTYAELATSRPVLRYAIRKTGARVTTTKLVETQAVRATSNEITRVVSIVVDYGDARIAADMANALAQRIRQLASATTRQETAALESLLDSNEIQTFTPEQQAKIGEAAKRVLGRSVAGQVAVVEPAEASDIPIAPRVTLITVLAALMGLMAVGVFVLVRESSGRALADERSLTALGEPAFLGTIEVPLARRGSEPLAVEGGSGTAADGYRGVATKLGFLDDRPPVQTLLVLDSTNGRRSGVVAANLAAVLAEADRHVVLLDANASSEGATQALGLEGRPGYGELLESPRQAELNGQVDDIRINRGANFDVLPRGATKAPPGLDVDRAGRLLDKLNQDAEIVIIAAAPINQSPTALVWARVTDGTLVVVDGGETPEELLQQALSSLGFVGANLVGTVLARPGRLRLSRPAQRVSA